MPTIWYNKQGEKISCTEKIKVMQENLSELKIMLQDLIDDGVLMGISDQQIKQECINLINSISSNYISTDADHS